MYTGNEIESVEGTLEIELHPKGTGDRLKELTRAYEACFHALTEQMEGKLHAAIAVKMAREKLDEQDNEQQSLCLICRENEVEHDGTLCYECSTPLMKELLGL